MFEYDKTEYQLKLEKYREVLDKMKGVTNDEY